MFISWITGSLYLALAIALIGVMLSIAERLEAAGHVDSPVAATSRWEPVVWVALYVAVAPPLGLVGQALRNLLTERTGALSQLPAGVRFVLALIVVEAIAYGVHRACHASTLLWRFHAVHHRPANVRWWATFRFHPLETTFSVIVPYLVIAALGFGAEIVGAVVGVVGVVTLLAHADVWVPGGWWQRVVVAPTYHRIHHQAGSQHTNFGLVSPLFDVVFGTANFDHLRTPSQHQQIPDAE